MTHRSQHQHREPVMQWRDVSIGLAVVLVVMLMSLVGQALAAPSASAAPWERTTATWYGPGFYGNTTACGQRYTQRIRGVAVPNSGASGLRCGAKLTIRYHGRVVRVRVIDTGGFSHGFDLSARTAMDLCRCTRPYTMRVAWHRGWRTPAFR